MSKDAALAGVRASGAHGTGIYYIVLPDGQKIGGRDLKPYLTGKAAMPGGTHVHYNFSPYDAQGKNVPPGDPRLEGCYVDAFLIPGAEAFATANQTGDESVNPAGGHDDHGCTPVVKIEHSTAGRQPVGLERVQLVVDGEPVGDAIESAVLYVD